VGEKRAKQKREKIATDFMCMNLKRYGGKTKVDTDFLFVGDRNTAIF
jgi:hypothetical protein